MNSLDVKKMTRNFVGIAILIFIVFSIPIITYCINFNPNSISNDPDDWGSFGDYLSGSSGILLSCIAVIFSIFSIYNTTKMSKYIFDNQIRPYPYLDLQKLPGNTSITIQNMGLGPLIINKIHIRYAEREIYKNFAELFSAKIKKINTTGAEIIYNSAPIHIIAPNNSKPILDLNPQKENNINFVNVQNNLRDVLKDCVIEIEYEDIAQNKSTYIKDLKFFNSHKKTS